MNALTARVDQMTQPDVFARELAFITDSHTLSVLAGRGGACSHPQSISVLTGCYGRRGRRSINHRLWAKRLDKHRL